MSKPKRIKRRLLSDPEVRRASLKAAIAAIPSSTEPTIRIRHIRIPDTLWGDLRRAARTREIEPNSYMLRAVYAMMAYDLGIPMRDILAKDPWVKRFTGVAVQDGEGTRFGSWVIEGMADDEGPLQG